ncbi:MAG: 50S ribosomal protein L21, partial [Lysobacterales bacterium CG17_big_fil_post_rev_8_21_14_2_50_64_11]
MYAVVVTGGKQYRVMQGEILRVELIDAEPGTAVTFDQVLLLGDGESIQVG